jgi:hypothetical protein
MSDNGTIKLEDADFYKWMYLSEVVSRKEAEAEAMRSQLEMANRNLSAMAVAMAKKYDVSFEKFGLDVATQSWVPRKGEDDQTTTSSSDTEGVVPDQ